MHEVTRLTRAGQLGAATALLRRGLGGHAEPKPKARIVPVGAPGGTFVAGSYADAEGTRAYKLYVPGGSATRGRPLVVMLHGCTQSADDFAAGTRMNVLAEANDCLVVYPIQSTSANGSRCWNWFSPAHQQRDRGEPAIIAGLTRGLAREHGVDPSRIYVAGLSSGGALAVTMATAYPEIYAAVGVHSGLAHGAATDMISAFAAMQRGGAARKGDRRAFVPTIVFHGDADHTVHPRNGEQVLAQARERATTRLETRVEHGTIANGRAYARTTHAHGDRVMLEHWLVRGAGHAWSGGSRAGSYTDPQGPDATREMLRFFASHRLGD
jgi:poly(hydroxyalkanoate) depolymerase family esterase